MGSDVGDMDRDRDVGGELETAEGQYSTKIEQQSQPQPRSRRVGMQLSSPPPNLVLDLATTNYTGLNSVTTPLPPSTPTTTDKPLPPRPPPPASPPVPARSPLRPPPRRSYPSPISTSPSGDSQKSNASAESHTGHTPIYIDSAEESPAEAPSRESIMSITKLLEEINSNPLFVHPSTSAMMNGTMSKAVPSKPPATQRADSPPLPTPPSNQEAKEAKEKAKSMTKRQHALHELLSSERAYASDLALIREVHIPLAMGLPASFIPPPQETSTSTDLILSSSSGSRTLSTASASTTSSTSTNFSTATTSTTATSISSVSTYAPFSTNNPPLSPPDTKTIFSNIAELAIFSDKFCDLLEEALGQEIDGGQGSDRVGQLFCQVISDLERPYKQYITKHPIALARLTALTVGLPAPDETSSHSPDSSRAPIGSYLALTKQIASTHSHAWDLPSLLIKPVQRLLKYPLLLQAIIDATPNTHSDYPRLKEAKERMEEVARAVNEGRRRNEVVREVLEKGKKGGGAAMLGLKDLVGIEAIGSIGGFVGVSGTPKKKGLGGKMKLKSPAKGTAGGDDESLLSISHNGSTTTLTPSSFSGMSTPPKEVNSEHYVVIAAASHLDDTYHFLHKLAKEMVEWARATKRSVEGLEVWAKSFGRVIGLHIEPDVTDGGTGSYDEINGIGTSSQGSGGASCAHIEDEALQSEAFDAFLNVVHNHLIPLAANLEKEIQARILDPISKLVQSMNEPKILINAMNAARPLHEHLLHAPITSPSSLASLSGSSSTKNRPSPALLQASSTYLALRGQLAQELPTYVRLLDSGVDSAIKEWVDLQAGYWTEVRMRWSELWEMLRVEGEGNGGARETVGIWEGRWKEVDELVHALKIVTPVQAAKDKKEKDMKKDKKSPKDKWRARSGSVGTSINVNLGVAGTLESLDPGKSGIARGRPSLNVFESSSASRVGGVATMLASLDPALPYKPHHGASTYSPLPSPGFSQGFSSGGLPYVSGPLPLTPRVRNRGASELPLRHGGASMYDMPSAIRREPSSHGDLSMTTPSRSERHSGHSSSSGRSGILDPADEMGLSAARSAQARRGSSRSRREPPQGDGASSYTAYPDGDTEYREAEDLRAMQEYIRALGLSESHGYDEYGEYVDIGPSTPLATLSSSAPMPKPSMQPRTKSMPALAPSSSTARTPEAPSARSSASSKILGDDRDDKDRGRTSRKPSLRRKFTDSLRSSHSSSSSIQNQAQQQQAQQPRRHRSPSAKSTNNETYFSVDPDAPPTPASNMTSFPTSHQGYGASERGGMTSRTSWTSAPGKYACRVIHACTPPPGVSYFGYPFFRLVVGDVYEVLHEAGHPSMHPKLPLHVDDGADCLLLVRDANATVGWALASFLIPLGDII